MVIFYPARDYFFQDLLTVPSSHGTFTLNDKSPKSFTSLIEDDTKTSCFFCQGFCNKFAFQFANVNYRTGYKAVCAAVCFLGFFHHVIVFYFHNFHHRDFQVGDIFYVFAGGFDVYNDFVSFELPFNFMDMAAYSGINCCFCQLVTFVFSKMKLV